MNINTLNGTPHTGQKRKCRDFLELNVTGLHRLKKLTRTKSNFSLCGFSGLNDNYLKFVKVSNLKTNFDLN